MSDNSRPPQPKFDGYFTVESEILKIGSTLPFDCFLYLERNDKVVHWLREGAVFGPLHAEKLEKFGKPKLLIMREQAHAYEKYAKVVLQPDVAPRLTGVEVIKDGPMHIKGTRPPPENIRVFGKTIIKSDEAIIRSAASSPIHAGTGNAPSVKVKVDVDFINIVIKSIQAVFNDLCKTKVTFKAPTKRVGKNEYPIQVNVASFIGLNSQTIRGTVGLCFPKQTYLYFLSAATGQSFNELTPELALGSGEFMYHIFETSRPNLTTLGYRIDSAVPFLVIGEDISIPHVLPDRGFSILFDSFGGQFQFEIGIKTGI